MSFIINPYMFSPAFANTKSIGNFSGTTQYMYINNQSNDIDTALRDTTPNFSVSGWVKLGAAGDGLRLDAIFAKYRNIAGNDRCFTISRPASNQFQVYGQYDTSNICAYLLTTATYTSANGWFHFVFVYDCTQTTVSTIAKLYINGTEVTSFAAQTVSTTNKYFFNQTSSGSRAKVRTNMWDGETTFPLKDCMVDEFTFWDKSLSSSEASELYNSGLAKDVSQMSSYSSNCVAWWRMGDYASDNWDGSKWNIINVKGTASTDLITTGMAQGAVQNVAP